MACWTLCITIAANIAKVGILTFPSCFPDSVVGFRPGHAATADYVRVWLSFVQKRLEDAAPESAQKNINLAILRSLELPVPPLEVQERFSNAILSHEAARAVAVRQDDSTNQLFASLQDRAFRGDL